MTKFFQMGVGVEFSRRRYVERLDAGIGSGQVKIVTGVRRCGKSYLLDILFRRRLVERGVPEGNIVGMDFDGFRNRAYRNPREFLAFVDARLQGRGPYFLLLDEVQLLDSFAEVLNDLIRMDDVDVYVTGSNARLLSRDVATEFRGRGEEIAMRPLSFSEFMEHYDGDRRDGYTEYATYGGLPSVVLREGAERKAEYLSAVFDETYIRDIIDRYHVRGTGDLNDLVDVLSSNIGGLTNPAKLSNTFRSSKRSTMAPDTVERLIGYLEDSFLFEKAVRYDIKGRRYIGADAKYYAVDTGLRNARVNFRQLEESHLMENIIYNELRGRGYGVDVGVVPSLRREPDGSRRRVRYEVDFVCNRGSRRWYIQSAFAMPTPEKREQEHASLSRIDDSFTKVIITKDGLPPHYDDQGVLNMNVYDFLLDPGSLER